MKKINLKEWSDQVITSKERIAIPIMTHPGIEIIGKTVNDACTNGDIHYQSIIVLNGKYPSSATTVIMDLTVEAEAFGAEIFFSDHEVPSVIGRLLSNKEEVEALEIPSLEKGRVGEYIKANKKTAESIQDKPVFSGCIGPYSLAGRLFDMTEIMMALYIEPDTIKLLLDKCTSFITAYCQALKEVGVSGIVMAEPAAGLLNNDLCQEFSSDYVKKIVDAVQDENFMVILHNCGNKGHCTNAMTSVGAMGYHFGNAIDMVAALDNSPKDTLVMGNIDPVSIMQQSSAVGVKNAVTELLERTKEYPNFILSTGCDTPPEVPEVNIEAFYEALKAFNQK